MVCVTNYTTVRLPCKILITNLFRFTSIHCSDTFVYCCQFFIQKYFFEEIVPMTITYLRVTRGPSCGRDAIAMGHGNDALTRKLFQVIRGSNLRTTVYDFRLVLFQRITLSVFIYYRLLHIFGYHLFMNFKSCLTANGNHWCLIFQYGQADCSINLPEDEEDGLSTVDFIILARPVVHERFQGLS